MPKITEFYAFVLADAGPDDEGVPALLRDGAWYPMMGADTKHIDSFRPYAQELANAKGKSIKLIRSTGIEVVEEIHPK